MMKKFFAILLLFVCCVAQAQFTPGQILTAAQLNSALAAKASTGTSGTSQLQYLQGATGSVARSVTSKLQDSVNVLDFGADPTGTTDSTTAFLNAAASLGSNGGTVRFKGWYLINSAMTLPDNVMLVGEGVNAAAAAYTPFTAAAFPSALVLNPAGGITLGNRNGVMNSLVITTALAPGGSCALPFANATVAANCVAAFSGTAFTSIAHAVDERLENLAVVGFNYLYNGNTGSTLSRVTFRHITGDCTNGYYVSNVADNGHGEDLEMYPFTTANQSWSTAALALRTGTAYMTGLSSTWMKWQDVFEYGWAIGFHFNGTGDTRCIACGADGPTGTAQSNVGYLYDGGVYNAYCIGCGATGQGDAGFRINVSPTNNVSSVTLIAPFAHGNNSANGYVDVQQGGYSITGGFFADNSSVGQVKIESGAGNGSIVGSIFGNGGAAPIYGDPTALGKMLLSSPTFQNTTPYTTTQPATTFASPSGISVASGGAVLLANRPAAQNGIIRYQTAGSDRWWAGVNSSAESGSNAGSNYIVQRFNDAGTVIDAPLTIVRSTGVVQLSDGVSLPQLTVSTLPTCNASYKGVLAAVSDATSPAYNASLTGGGAVSVPVYCNGSSWTAH